MHVTRSILVLMAGAASGIALVLSCGDNLSVKARADAAIDAPNAPDAAPTCDCPAAEPPLAGRFVVVSNTWAIAANATGHGGVPCPAGAQFITGSCTTDDPTAMVDVILRESGFLDYPPTAWRCSFHNNEPMPVMFRASVVCLKPTP